MVVGIKEVEIVVEGIEIVVVIEQFLFATHAPVPKQYGVWVNPIQSWYDEHPRHVWLVVSQIGVIPEQSLFDVHTTHEP